MAQYLKCLNSGESKLHKSLIIILVSLLLSACNKHSDHQVLVLSGSTMGTSFNIQIVNNPNKKSFNKDLLAKEINDILERTNNIMSTWRKDSELSKINDAAIKQWIKVSPELLNIFELAQSISKLSNGAFDITVGSIINLWGFGSGGRNTELPNDISIAQAKLQMGYRHLIIDRNLSAIKKNRKMYIDLSAIAKGYGVDTIAKHLDSYKIAGYLIEIGGEIRVKGKKADNTDWKIAIESPGLEFKKVHQIITISDAAIATSGDYRNYFKQAGLHYSHTLNPLTGKPITHKLVSVTVLAKNAATADAFATALMVMGPEQGFNFSETHNLAAYFIYREKNEFKVRITKKFKRNILPYKK